MILRKYMSLIGVGSAKIDLVLPKNSFKLGELLHGYFFLEGGIIEQKLKRVECDLVMLDNNGKKEKIIDSTTVLKSDSIKAEERNKLAFTYRIPETLPYSNENGVRYLFKTKLTFDQGVESYDEDYISIC
ncbi:sporulation protein (plasmid) [Cytobacillus spongiae]|uniref:sporulation protein n=1 Tax=Cytobacillus spongiae TaxID=2901381 RepID=UPI001CD4FFF8|nr:sporulation protein [Cytobacillus spongiae]MCA1062666.1 sporulation protein [Rossellomorea aquimaris]UII58299.1 sporulation protein [Cytobacillus spongiae]WJV28668.1 sporulation protein [Rossellomorea sp. AcN35-11]